MHAFVQRPQPSLVVTILDNRTGFQAKPLKSTLDLLDLIAMLKGDDRKRASFDPFGCRSGGERCACMALVVGYPFRGGSPASMVTRTP